MSNTQQNNLKIGAVAVVLVILAVVLSVGLGRGGKKTAAVETEPETAMGVAYLQQLEARDPKGVDDTLRAYRAEELAAERKERIEQLTSGEVNVWGLFEDYVLLGDSRATGFEVYEFLPDSRVLAANGETILAIPDRIEEVKQLNPSNIFLCYGINDVYGGMWTDGKTYASDYLDAVRSIREILPDSTIYISSIMPVTEPALSNSAKWAMIPEFNEEIRKMCEENGVHYVDNEEISAAHTDLWEGDGIHFNRAFYPYWASNLMIAVYDAAVAMEESAY